MKQLKPLTKAQEEVLVYARSFIIEYHYFPTTREIGDNFGYTQKGAYDHLQLIAKKGYITQYRKSHYKIIYDEKGRALQLQWRK